MRVTLDWPLRSSTYHHTMDSLGSAVHDSLSLSAFRTHVRQPTQSPHSPHGFRPCGGSASACPPHGRKLSAPTGEEVITMPTATFHDSLLDSDEAAAVQASFEEALESDD